MANVILPTGSNAATVAALASDGTDITSSCSISAESSDPTVVAVGTMDPASPNVVPLNVVGAPGSTCTLTYTATNSAGSVSQTDSVSVAVVAPASLSVTYASSIPAGSKALKK